MYYVIQYSVAPSAAPTSLNVTSITLTSISIAWDRVPCLERNADITQYDVSHCLASDSSCGTIEIVPFVDNMANRVLNITGLIPRTNYIIRISADHINFDSRMYLLGPYSEPLIAETAVIQGESVYIPCLYMCLCIGAGLF